MSIPDLVKTFDASIHSLVEVPLTIPDETCLREIFIGDCSEFEQIFEQIRENLILILKKKTVRLSELVNLFNLALLCTKSTVTSLNQFRKAEQIPESFQDLFVTHARGWFEKLVFELTRSVLIGRVLSPEIGFFI